jgi:hypothetical protein
MKARIVCALALAASACGSSGGGTAVLKLSGHGGGATTAAASAAAADPSVPTVFGMKLVAAYLSEDVDPVTQNNRGQTPMIYLNPACGGDIEHCDLSAGTAPDGRPISRVVDAYFDLALPADQVNAALNAQARAVAKGTYRYLRVEWCKYNAGGANDVRWGTADVGPIEFLNGGCVVTVPITPPIAIGSGDAVTITLAYDLVGTVQTGVTASGTSCADAAGTRVCFTVPAFVPSASR